MIKAFLFDLGGVLFTNGTKKFISYISSQYSLNEDNVKEIIDGNVGSQYREAKISREEFWRHVKEKLNLKESPDELEKEWINRYKLIPETKEIIAKLATNYKVYYLSDNVKERVDKLDERFHFLSLFTDGIFSHKVGVRKPDPEIYQYALEKTQTPPQETVFIDDKPIMLEPAKKLGMVTILFNTPDKLKQELRKLNIINI